MDRRRLTPSHSLCLSVNSALYEEILDEVVSSAYVPRAIPLRVVLEGRPVLQRPVSVHRNSSAEGGSVFAQFSRASHRQSRASIDEDRTSRLSLLDLDRGSLGAGADLSLPDSASGRPLDSEGSLAPPLPIQADDEAAEEESAPLVTLQDVFAELFPGRAVR
jgi:hypothetical protein